MARSSGSMQPLSVGNVISASIRLYGNHLKQYLLIAVIAAGWSILPTIIDWGIQAIFFGSTLAQLSNPAAASNPAGNPGILLLFRLAILALAIYCSAKYYLNLGLLSRLAFGELMEKPEPTATARDRLKPIMFRFLVTQILVGLLAFAVIFGVFLGWFILSNIISRAVGSQNILLGVLVNLVLLIAAIGLTIWVCSRWFLAEVPLAIEEESTSGAAIGRSWKLTQGYATRILMIVLVAGIITLPLYAVASIPFLSAVFAAAPLAAQQANNINSAAAAGAMVQIITGLALSFLLVLIFNTFVVPFWQSIKSVIYFDLRNRQEGLGLQLRDRTP
ncbi:hypothetical protein ACN4EK_11430 [Pantanalinema rosaneae CENA516]|uniref:hypothetical protein n=1 Tax=Pantanalinema rosaneae TaxID=1620701 RepID=UPI003D701101